MFNIFKSSSIEPTPEQVFTNAICNAKYESLKATLSHNLSIIESMTSIKHLSALFNALEGFNSLNLNGDHSVILYDCKLNLIYDNGKLINIKIVELD
tara:strand:+ start:3795 stop:4085 length:291 start_codon:yes stop_codon:yes gene_type:complete